MPGKSLGVYTTHLQAESGTVTGVTMTSCTFTGAANNISNAVLNSCSLTAVAVSSGTVTGLTSFNTASGSTVGFYGVTPVARQASATHGKVSNSAFVLLSATMTSAATGWVFQTSTQANDTVTDIIELQNRLSATIVLVNGLQTALVAMGAILGSAS